jgi:kumamolisin
MPAMNRSLPLVGSHRELLAGSRESGKLDPDERVRVTVIVRNRSSDEERLAVDRLGGQALRKRTYITPEEFVGRYGASREDLAKVEAFARDNGLEVMEVSPAKRSVVLSGTIGQLRGAFKVDLKRYTHPRGVFRGRTGPVYLPAELTPVVKAVLGLDSRPQADAHFRIAKAAGGITYAPTRVGQLYDYPAQLDGTGESVAIVELGGGYDIKDLQTYFSGIGIKTPSVLSVSVDGAANSPTGDAAGPDAEVFLDVEVVGSLAPNAEIVVYFAPNTDAGFVDAVLAAIHDAEHKPSVVSISWGSAESTWTQQGMESLNQALQDAALLGVSVCVAAGDSGSSDGVNDGLAHVDFPASSQYALGCGGTRLKATGETITGEVVWNDEPSGGATGGGVSDVFPLPSWQSRAGVPPSANSNKHVGRGVPDVSGDADPSTGYLVLVDGDKTTVGGTSAVAPLWAGLIARFNQSLGKPVGYLNPLLYRVVSSSGAFRDIVSGNNGAYSAGPGWDACTGLGSPDGAKLLEALSSA